MIEIKKPSPQNELPLAFVSYSRNNKDIAEKIINVLEANDLSTYIDFRDIPPGSIYAEEIVNAIERAVCCVLVFTEDSNKSGYVLNEMNSAVNHNIPIIPVKVGDFSPSKALEYYLGKNNWYEYNDDSSLNALVSAIKSITKIKQSDKEYKYTEPTVLRSEQLSKIGYTVEKKVIETIEIDYKTLGEAPNEYSLDEESEGTLVDWFDYANSYPETASMLVVNDKIVGYYQFELIDEKNYRDVVSGAKIISSEMQEFYGFGGSFYCYIVVMPILREHETQNNYLLLIKDLFDKIVDFYNRGIIIDGFAISVYTPLLKKMMQQLGFVEVSKNTIGGTIMELTKDAIKTNKAIKNSFPEVYKRYGDVQC